MIKIALQGFDEAMKKYADAQRPVEIAAQRALLKTAHAIKEAEISEMKRVFNSPTRWTLGSIRVRATKKMVVEVGILDPDGYYKRAASYIGQQVSGGQRKLKAMDTALQSRGFMPRGWVSVPGQGARLDEYGNMSVGQVKQILTWFDAAERWAGSTQNMNAAGREKRRKGMKKHGFTGFEYFVVMPGARGKIKQPGVYQRFFIRSGSGGISIKPVLIFVTKANYSARFDFMRVALDVKDRMLSDEFDKALQRELNK